MGSSFPLMPPQNCESTHLSSSPQLCLQSLHITGVKVAYYFICHRKLWLFTHGIQLEKEHENVMLGKMLHEERYKRKRKEVLIDQTINIDFVKTSRGIEIHEIKKTKRMEKAHIYQLLFYLYYLKQRGLEAKGFINYPLLNKVEEVSLQREKEEEIRTALREIDKIIKGPVPEKKRKHICSKCAYLEFCFCCEEE